MHYKAPVEDIAFTLRFVSDFGKHISNERFENLSDDLIDAVLKEAGKFASDKLAPLNVVGDVQGAARHSDGRVTVPDRFADIYKQWCEAGWNSLTGKEEWGGQGLPIALASAVNEMWTAANMAFHLCPLLTAGAIEALQAHGSEELKEVYLRKLVSGEWTGTMNLTEPQAGSDLAALKTKAMPAENGTYKIIGQKIYITFGEHDMADNIIHLVLARLPDAPAGTRGISLFLVPKILPDGSRNDLICSGIEHKLGIHASPTCTMVFGDNGGATGWLVGEENRGLACMFTMMNNARLNVGIEGVGISERAYQHALAYAQERKQGKALNAPVDDMSPIIEHPDVRRMLMHMRATNEAARSICLACAVKLDEAKFKDDNAKQAYEIASLLTPVAKAYSTDLAMETTSIGIQVQGGMGYIEETGAAQHMRDARIAPIYEGTNGIQAIDLVMRKVRLSEGQTIKTYIETLKTELETARGSKDENIQKLIEPVENALIDFEAATNTVSDYLANKQYDAALSVAMPYLHLFGTAAGGIYLLKGAIAAQENDVSPGQKARRVAMASYFANNVSPKAHGLKAAVEAGTAGVADFDSAVFAS
jgi:acyl-CoA dehydrogenase